MNKKTNRLHVLILLFILMFSTIINTNISCADEFTNSQDITINSNSAILVDPKTGQVLYEYNADEVTYPASTTKLMTAILTLENCNLDDTVTITSESLKGIPYSYTIANLQVGEKLTIDQLLHVLLIPSANDAANVLAFHISGSLDDFSTLMNEKAKEIGATNTHFVNPSGIHDDNHYSTARDMCLIGKYAYKFDKIREIAQVKEYSLPNLPDGTERKFKTTNMLRTEESPNFYEYATGLKTGYTDKAKSCIVATAQKNDSELLCVVLGGTRISEKNTYRDVDCITLFNYGFDEFTDMYVCTKNENVNLSKLSDVPEVLVDTDVIFADDIHMLVNKQSDLTPTVEWKNNLELPIEKNAVVGTITYTINGNDYSVDILSKNGIYPASSHIVQYIFYGLIALLVFMLIVKPLLFRKKKKTRKRNSGYWEF